MQVDRNLIDYYPEFLKEYYRPLVEGYEPELQTLWKQVENPLLETYLFTASEYGISRLEKILNIQTKDSDTLDDRRFLIQTILSQTQVITLTTLIDNLKSLCGEDGYRVEVTYSEYKLKVMIELSVKRQFDIVDEMVRRIVPVNLLVEVVLLYNTHEILANYTHAQLSAWTHEHIRNEVLN